MEMHLSPADEWGSESDLPMLMLGSARSQRRRTLTNSFIPAEATLPMISRYGRPDSLSSSSSERLLLSGPRCIISGTCIGWSTCQRESSGLGCPRNYFLWRPRARGCRAGSSMGGAWRGRRDRPAKLPVRVTPWRHEGDSVGAGSGLRRPERSHRNCMQARQRRGTTREPVQYCGALTMARADELSEESNADELENRTLIDQMLSKTKIRPTVLPR